LECTNGEKYEGQWKDNEKNGTGNYECKAIGTLQLPNRETYEGQWRTNKKDGKGITDT
jgi:hypothetical protein